MKIKDNIMNSDSIKTILSEFSKEEMEDAMLIIENMANTYQEHLDKIDKAFVNKENVTKFIDALDEIASKEIFSDE